MFFSLQRASVSPISSSSLKSRFIVPKFILHQMRSVIRDDFTRIFLHNGMCKTEAIRPARPMCVGRSHPHKMRRNPPAVAPSNPTKTRRPPHTVMKKPPNSSRRPLVPFPAQAAPELLGVGIKNRLRPPEGIVHRDEFTPQNSQRIFFPIHP